ncbi:MAG: histone deacetylase family protein [Gammaproteobacteria bacterium]|jgi:acetoin utilization deacetylase AcuC-like enzyme|nr:histone deacetylase family protein [Gammaproteobacteria bacterium]MCP4879144.1 histone deacetylase family protein [Gammaproteobacteria bacterium]MDP6165941.1 histone deacetylase family protein [Gammaproteobacteria bacterium]
MKIIYSPHHTQHNTKTELSGGELVAPYECASRMDYVCQALQEYGLGKTTEPLEFPRCHVEKIHDKDYLSFLDNCWQQWQATGMSGEAIPTIWPSRSMPSNHIPRNIEGQIGYYALAGETAIAKNTAQAAWLSANIALTAAHSLVQGEHSAFALARPPGHHASKNQYGGYCFINNAAVAAQYLLDNGFQRVALMDVDFHHGNGTQDIFYERNDVFFSSIHGDPLDAFPHFLGHADETGIGAGVGYNLNHPLPQGTPYAIWSEKLEQSLNAFRNYGADVLVVSLGLDTYEHDPISFFKVKTDEYVNMGTTLAGLDIPTVFIMEGGYAVEKLGHNTANVLQGFLNV